jgi:hypothetical protein
MQPSLALRVHIHTHTHTHTTNNGLATPLAQTCITDYAHTRTHTDHGQASNTRITLEELSTAFKLTQEVAGK